MLNKMVLTGVMLNGTNILILWDNFLKATDPARHVIGQDGRFDQSDVSLPL